MTQNIYDQDDFFAAYSGLPRSVEGLDGAPEWPALRALLPQMRGLRVLDLGCGFGWFCRWAAEQGAASVLGIDVSEKMLGRARATTDADTISYARSDLEEVDLPPASFDLAYSSLAFHYLRDIAALFAKLHAALVPGGSLVFSVEHPIYTAPSNPGFVPDADGKPVWPLDRYLDEGPRTTDWLAKGVVKQHRMLETYVNALIAAGFTVTHVEEWAPSAEQVAVHPDWVPDRERPPFLLVRAGMAK
jgi:SAM-dependent methyltransferase